MKLDINKTKSFNISLISEGIELQKMKFKFSIEINETIVSFPVKVNGDNLQVIISPLSEKIKNVSTGTYNAYLESYSLNEDKKGYYLRPWEDKIEIIKESKLEVKISEEKDPFDIKAKIVEDDKPEPPESYTMKETSDKKKYSKFGKKLFGDE